MTALEKLQKQAIELPENERADLASVLIRSLDVPHHYVSDEEVERRCQDLADGSVQEISHEELISRVNRGRAK